MADNLQWIRFSNGKEKQVPKHIALDPSVQKAQNFEPITKKGGTVLPVTTAAPPPQKKNVAAVSPDKQEVTASADAITPSSNSAKELYKQNKAGKSFVEIAKSLGIHWRAVEQQINDYKQANQIDNETPTPEHDNH